MRKLLGQNWDAVTSAELIAAIRGQDTTDSANACWVAMCRTPNYWRLGGIHDLRKLAHSTGTHEGQMVSGILRESYAHDTVPESVVGVWNYLATVNTKNHPVGTASELRPGQYKFAYSMMVDAMVALGEWLLAWNKRVSKRVAANARRLECLDS